MKKFYTNIFLSPKDVDEWLAQFSSPIIEGYSFSENRLVITISTLVEINRKDIKHIVK